jgi:glutaredoxin
MKAILILAGPYSSCMATQEIWEDSCAEYNIELESFDLSNEAAQRYIEQFNLKSFPALIINNKVVAVGHPTNLTAIKLLSISGFNSKNP